MCECHFESCCDELVCFYLCVLYSLSIVLIACYVMLPFGNIMFIFTTVHKELFCKLRCDSSVLHKLLQ